MTAKHNFRELKIWHLAMELAHDVYSLTSSLPDDERYGMVSQMNRSSISIASNIAEGSGRSTNKDFNRFLNISLSSSYELETQLILCKRIFETKIDNTQEKLNELQRMITGFQKTLN